MTRNMTYAELASFSDMLAADGAPEVAKSARELTEYLRELSLLPDPDFWEQLDNDECPLHLLAADLGMPVYAMLYVMRQEAGMWLVPPKRRTLGRFAMILVHLILGEEIEARVQ